MELWKVLLLLLPIVVAAIGAALGGVVLGGCAYCILPNPNKGESYAYAGVWLVLILTAVAAGVVVGGVSTFLGAMSIAGIVAATI